MTVKCYNCGEVSPDREEWELTKLGWTGSSKRWITGSDWEKGDTLSSISERIGFDWYCPYCMEAGFSNTFGLPVRLANRRN